MTAKPAMAPITVPAMAPLDRPPPLLGCDVADAEVVWLA